ncbi:MAG: hypothetical protein KJO95_00760 [Gammaproteobacteria bacterium]|nr:hypothetical protein [Gammaproteobacteria bacterium]MBU2678588.1 hypothetical protein [Gammaproteobacteria bacterium]NNC57554.1 hypothetical protein [Woeseiaceae bacterium]NNL52322.1 hypothetical protein [Woeseiaceae bacterium]
MDHRVGRAVFASVVGLAAAVFSYLWITDPEPRAVRAEEERVVEASRALLESVVSADSLEIVDPLAPNRKVGKVYVFAESPGWAVSGYYRRGEPDSWHPYLMMMTADFELRGLKVRDAALLGRAADDPRLDVRR